jgi:DNA invertase Pin-like site-specific DNA recombinase
VKRSLSPNRTKAKAPPARAGLRVGYLRVSALDQKEVRQLDGLELDKRFTDKVSGKDRNRPQLEQMIEFVREGDTVFCHSMDRLARNLDDLRLLVKKLTGKSVKVCFVKENLTFTGEDSPMANLLLSVMGAIAEFERELIKERQREGIAIAKRRGAYAGRKRTLTAAQAVVLLERIAAGESKTKLASELGVSRNTIYMYVSRGGK